MPAALSPDHDDDGGGVARRASRSRSNATPASELRRPLGISIVGGLLLSQFLTLYTTPVIYLYMERARRWFDERRHRGRLEQAPLPLRADAKEREPEFARAGANGNRNGERGY